MRYLIKHTWSRVKKITRHAFVIPLAVRLDEENQRFCRHVSFGKKNDR